MRRLRIGGKSSRIAGEQDIDLEPPRLEMTRDHECVAAIVAGAGEHNHPAAAIRHDIARNFCRGETRALHERSGIRSAERSGLDGADLRGSIHRNECARLKGHALQSGYQLSLSYVKVIGTASNMAFG